LPTCEFVMPNYLQSVDIEWFNQRLARVFVIVLIAFTVLAARLVYLQVIKGEDLRRLSEINSIRLQDIEAPRGLIYDNQYQLLVENRPSFNLHIILKDAKPLELTLDKLSKLINEPVEELHARIRATKHRGSYTPILLKADISREVLAAVEVHRFQLPGIQVNVAPRRHYIHQHQGAHLLGYLGEISMDELQNKVCDGCKSGDFIGKFGIEKAFDSFMRGKRGGRQVEVNAIGQVERVIETVHAVPGNNMLLTVDWKLQQKAEEMMVGRVGAAIAIEPATGKLLAMVSNPSFDPNQFVTGITRERWSDLINNPYRPLENKALQGEYPPASTYKVVTAIAGLEEKVVNAQTKFYCPGFYRFAGRPYRCWKRGGHGEMDVVSALSESCDVYFYRTGELLGVDRIAKYAKALGLGRATEISLDRESRGLIPTAEWKLRRFKEPWQKGETLSIAIGQGFNLTTPLQMAVLSATLANGGIRYKPYILDRIFSPDDQVIFENSPEEMGRIQLQPETVKLIRQGLWEVVNHPKGTAGRSRIKGLEYSGKTGTAQVVSRIEGDDDRPVPKDHAWFIAYAPSEHPKIAVSVIVEHGESGSGAAAPVAGAMIRTYLGMDPPADASKTGVAAEASGPPSGVPARGQSSQPGGR
jgi:penicillin-binding protein 2